MFALFVTAKIKPGHRAEFIEATMGDAVGSNNDEPGCLQFDVHADPTDENTVYLYEVYQDKDAWETAHRSAPHYTCLLYTSPSPRDGLLSRMPSSD